MAEAIFTCVLESNPELSNIVNKLDSAGTGVK